MRIYRLRTQAQGRGCALNDKLRSNQSLWQRIEFVGAGGLQVRGSKEHKLEVCFVLTLNMGVTICIKEYVSPVRRSTNLMDRHTPAFGGLGRSSTYSRPELHEQRGFSCKVILAKIHMVSTKRYSANKKATVNASTVVHRSDPSSPALDKNSRCIALEIS